MGEINLKLASSLDELQFLFDTRTDPRVAAYLSGPPPSNIEKHFEYVEKVQGKSRWIYIAYLKSHEKLGYSQIYDVTDAQLEVGFAIHPEFQGKGYGNQLVLETIQQARKNFPNRKLTLQVLASNSKAIHIYKKLGFREIKEQENLLHMELL